MRVSRLSGGAGIGFATIILLVNVAIFVPAGLPSPGAGDGAVTEFFSAPTDAVAVGTSFLPAAWLLAVIFAAGVVTVAREHSRMWALVGLAGVVSQNLTILFVSAIRLAIDATHPPRQLLHAMWALHDASFLLNGTFLAMALLGLSLAGRQAGVIPGWVAVGGLVAGCCQFASATLTPWVMRDGAVLGLIGLAGWLLWVGWLVAFGIALVRFTPIRTDRIQEHT
ncbi:DUF4386 family protein [Microbacterium lushaniae]|nr:DUF4386 family protein [Microbacterium lushaniae]